LVRFSACPWWAALAAYSNALEPSLSIVFTVAPACGGKRNKLFDFQFYNSTITASTIMTIITSTVT
jgi:hypothetical protein